MRIKFGSLDIEADNITSLDDVLKLCMQKSDSFTQACTQNGQLKQTVVLLVDNAPRWENFGTIDFSKVRSLEFLVQISGG